MDETLNLIESVSEEFPSYSFIGHHQLALEISYDTGNLRQNYGLIRGLPLNHTMFADWAISGWYIYQKGPKQAGLIITLD